MYNNVKHVDNNHKGHYNGKVADISDGKFVINNEGIHENY